jgi:hypothetical protein
MFRSYEHPMNIETISSPATVALRSLIFVLVTGRNPPSGWVTVFACASESIRIDNIRQTRRSVNLETTLARR